jgi:Na+/melibiose symporter-like transporter
MDPVSIMGLIADIVIVALSFAVHSKKKNKTFYYIGVAYILFALSYIMVLSNLAAMSRETYLLVRAVAYLTMIFGLYKELGR